MKKTLVGLLIVLNIFVFSGCTWWSAEEVEPEVVQEEPQPEVVLDYYKILDVDANLEFAKGRFNLANDSALEWQADAQLLLVSTKFVNSLSDIGVVDRFLFSSNIRPDLYFAIDISREDIDRYTRNLIFVEDYVLKSGVLPLPLKYWGVTANEAIEMADSMGGAQFRDDNTTYNVTQVLSLAGGNNMAWYIVYTSGENVFEVIIDASSSEVIV